MFLDEATNRSPLNETSPGAEASGSNAFKTQESGERVGGRGALKVRKKNFPSPFLGSRRRVRR